MIHCDIIQDLLPLYVDNVASESSRAMIDAHIKSCENCRAVFAKLQGGGEPVSLTVDKAEIGAFKKMKRKIFRKILMITGLSILVTVVGIYGFFGCYTPLPYDPNKLSVTLSYGGAIDVLYEGKYTGATGIQWDDAVYIGFDGTLFTRLFPGGEVSHYPIADVHSAVFDESGQRLPQINRVYYMDYRKLPKSAAAVEDAKDEAILLWRR